MGQKQRTVWRFDNFAVRKALNMSTVSKVFQKKSINLCVSDIHRLDNYQQFLGSWSIARFNVYWLSWAQQSITMHFSWSVSETVWQYTICCNALTPNHWQNLDPVLRCFYSRMGIDSYYCTDSYQFLLILWHCLKCLRDVVEICVLVKLILLYCFYHYDE